MRTIYAAMLLLLLLLLPICMIFQRITLTEGVQLWEIHWNRRLSQPPICAVRKGALIHASKKWHCVSALNVLHLVELAVFATHCTDSIQVSHYWPQRPCKLHRRHPIVYRSVSTSFLPPRTFPFRLYPCFEVDGLCSLDRQCSWFRWLHMLQELRRVMCDYGLFSVMEEGMVHICGAMVMVGAFGSARVSRRLASVGTSATASGRWRWWRGRIGWVT